MFSDKENMVIACESFEMVTDWTAYLVLSVMVTKCYSVVFKRDIYVEKHTRVAFLLYEQQLQQFFAMN